jgi:thioredoxin 1
MTIIKFQQPNCVPCKSVSDFLDGKVEYKTIDAFENPDICMSFGIMSVPVVILLNDEGKEIKRSNGYKPTELTEIINLSK